MAPCWLADRLPDFGAAIGALIDELDLRHAPMGLYVPDIHRQKSHASRAEDRSSFVAFVMLNVGWHWLSFGPEAHFCFDPELNLARAVELR
jgi:hypothetical protein